MRLYATAASDHHLHHHHRDLFLLAVLMNVAYSNIHSGIRFHVCLGFVLPIILKYFNLPTLQFSVVRNTAKKFYLVLLVPST